MLNEYASEINGDPEKFAELASKYSDCSSHSNGGDLGFFKPVSCAYSDLSPHPNVLRTTGPNAEAVRGRHVFPQGRRD